MNDKEFEQLKEMVQQVKSINNKLDNIINNLDGNRTDSQELKERSIVNGLLHICTHKEFDDKQYTDALRQLGELPFGLSAKQLAWCLVYTPRHPDCGEEIEGFIYKQFGKQKDKTQYVDQIAEVLKTKYTNDNNADFIHKLIARIKEM